MGQTISKKTGAQFRRIVRDSLDRRATVGRGIHPFLAGINDFRRQALFAFVVAYYNGEEIWDGEKIWTAKDEPQSPVVEDFCDEFGTDFTFYRGLERLAVLLRLTMEGFDPFERKEAQQEKARSDAEELRKTRRKFCQAMQWLCSVKISKPEKDSGQMKTSLELGRYPFIGREHENFIRYFEDHGLRHFKAHPTLAGGRISLGLRCPHFIDLFCAFLLAECQNRAPDEMPVKICRRCEKLFMSHRANAKFCSEECQKKAYWTDERKRDYAWVEKLEDEAEFCVASKHGYSPGDLRNKLQKPKVRNRLREIESRWREWPKIMTKVRTIRAAGRTANGALARAREKGSEKQ